MSTIVEQLKTIIAEDLDTNIEKEAIDENVPLFEDGLGLDSIATVELISAIEHHFDFQFDDAELSPEAFKSLKVLAELVASKTESQPVETVS